MKYTNHKIKALNYLTAHPEFNATIHALGGVSVGILIMYYFKIQDPLTWGIFLGALSILGHLWAASKGKK